MDYNKSIITDMFADFNSFFINEKDGKYICKFGQRPNFAAYGTGDESFVNIPDVLPIKEVESDEAKLCLLFMVGHELAHSVNRHLDHIDKHDFDTRTIEMWADYFGAKIAMNILQSGQYFHTYLDVDRSNANDCLLKIFDSLELLAKVFEEGNDSKKYLVSYERVSTVIGGMLSYLTRKNMLGLGKMTPEDQAEIGVEWGRVVNLKLLEHGLIEKLSFEAKKTGDSVNELASNSVDIHKKLKGESIGQLLKGLPLDHQFLLDTSYESHSPNPLLVKKAQELLEGWGIDTSEGWK